MNKITAGRFRLVESVQLNENKQCVVNIVYDYSEYAPHGDTDVSLFSHVSQRKLSSALYQQVSFVQRTDSPVRPHPSHIVTRSEICSRNLAFPGPSHITNMHVA